VEDRAEVDCEPVIRDGPIREPAARCCGGKFTGLGGKVGKLACFDIGAVEPRSPPETAPGRAPVEPHLGRPTAPVADTLFWNRGGTEADLLMAVDAPDREAAPAPPAGPDRILIVLRLADIPGGRVECAMMGRVRAGLGEGEGRGFTGTRVPPLALPWIWFRMALRCASKSLRTFWNWFIVACLTAARVPARMAPTPVGAPPTIDVRSRMVIRARCCSIVVAKDVLVFLEPVREVAEPAVRFNAGGSDLLMPARAGGARVAPGTLDRPGGPVGPRPVV
jgi:hypothetical protein